MPCYIISLLQHKPWPNNTISFYKNKNISLRGSQKKKKKKSRVKVNMVPYL